MREGLEKRPIIPFWWISVLPPPPFSTSAKFIIFPLWNFSSTIDDQTPPPLTISTFIKINKFFFLHIFFLYFFLLNTTKHAFKMQKKHNKDLNFTLKLYPLYLTPTLFSLSIFFLIINIHINNFLYPPAATLPLAKVVTVVTVKTEVFSSSSQDLWIGKVFTFGVIGVRDNKKKNKKNIIMNLICGEFKIHLRLILGAIFSSVWKQFWFVLRAFKLLLSSWMAAPAYWAFFVKTFNCQYSLELLTYFQRWELGLSISYHQVVLLWRTTRSKIDGTTHSKIVIGQP